MSASLNGNIRLFVAMPVYGSIPVQVALAMDALKTQERPYPVTVNIMCQHACIPYVRNMMTAGFLETDHTHLMFIDSDIIFRGEHITRLLSHDEPIVGGLYCKKQPELAWVYCPLPAATHADQRGLLPVRLIGTGFLLIKRCVFEAMKDPAIEYLDGYSNRRGWDFWGTGVKDGRYLTEDYWFCERARELGFNVFADTQVKLQHIGTATYPLPGVPRNNKRKHLTK